VPRPPVTRKLEGRRALDSGRSLRAGYQCAAPCHAGPEEITLRFVASWSCYSCLIKFAGILVCHTSWILIIRVLGASSGSISLDLN
jgi:hypothetical protein